ncbi:MAG TPA: nitroreductase/quinone reductase family protein [Acidimicrobiales bacterium]|jgi:deazaflavin-dependent oxidoreductase (nitroreductase family)|nr:nitroreductase/quinone reductase family protein [Acidimicrobiales bacterium]
MSEHEAEPESQAATEFEEPPREQIPDISRAHVAILESGDGDKYWKAAGMSHLILRTVGRRTGNEHKVVLPFWRDTGGSRVVVGSFAGSPQHPSWYLNLTDRSKNAEVLVRVREGSYWAEPEILEGDEYDRVWAALTADRPFYVRYTERTSRVIPLVRLGELRPG